jgi:hypothetical protein
MKNRYEQSKIDLLATGKITCPYHSIQEVFRRKMVNNFKAVEFIGKDDKEEREANYEIEFNLRKSNFRTNLKFKGNRKPLTYIEACRLLRMGELKLEAMARRLLPERAIIRFLSFTESANYASSFNSRNIPKNEHLFGIYVNGLNPYNLTIGHIDILESDFSTQVHVYTPAGRMNYYVSAHNFDFGKLEYVKAYNECKEIVKKDHEKKWRILKGPSRG